MFFGFFCRFLYVFLGVRGYFGVIFRGFGWFLAFSLCVFGVFWRIFCVFCCLGEFGGDFQSFWVGLVILIRFSLVLVWFIEFWGDFGRVWVLFCTLIRVFSSFGLVLGIFCTFRVFWGGLGVFWELFGAILGGFGSVPARFYPRCSSPPAGGSVGDPLWARVGVYGGDPPARAPGDPHLPRCGAHE